MLYVQGQAWPTATPPGLFRPNRAQLHSAAVNLAVLDNLRPEATPHPWGPAMAFGRHLCGNPTNATDRPAVDAADSLIEIYLGGLLTGVLSVEHIPYGGAAGGTALRLSEILRKSSPFQAGGQLPAGTLDVRHSLPVLVHIDANGGAQPAVLGVFHPDCLFFPAAANSGWPATLNGREQQVLGEYQARLAAPTGVAMTNVDLVRSAVDQLLSLDAAGTAQEPWVGSLRRLQAKLNTVFQGAPVASRLSTKFALPVRANGQFVAWSVPALDVPFFRALDIQP